ncbi:pseudaminic acid cytidylyltransferase [Psychromonas sp. CNPT3]|uniref:pseudaminic acid cytidylyltransferase n=1 Tax=Psychromonas sp. CNPT3 TaxID=314282 RepID=UPI0005A2B12C|nr:pseudaminic acid cytidylyltransferase [Psychromonas sp. CNPT3]
MRVAIIPARGGSKRIPRKNIKMFHGKPIIAYSIEAALKANCFERVIVSTDDKEVAQIALAYGAEVPFMRPAEIADDHATTMDVLQHAIKSLQDQGSTPTHICCIYATAPFISSVNLERAFTLLKQKQCNYVYSATPFCFPIQRAIRINSEGESSMFNPENANTRSQDLEPAYHDAGQFYWGLFDAFIQAKNIFSDHAFIFKLAPEEVQDIDTFADWSYAEILYEILNRPK